MNESKHTTSLTSSY